MSNQSVFTFMNHVAKLCTKHNIANVSAYRLKSALKLISP